MYAASSPSEPNGDPFAQPRVRGGVRVSFRRRGQITHLGDCEERDGYRVRFPRCESAFEGVIINTGGGVAGGDRVTHMASLDEAASVTLTTQAAERIYRSSGCPSRIDAVLKLGPRSDLAWLPQETILYGRSHLIRSFGIDMTACASLLMAEMAVFGRREMGESVTSGYFKDRWRIRRGGKLVYAENIDFEGDLGAGLRRPAIADGGRIVATVLFVDPQAEDRLELVRNTLVKAVSRIAASAWNGLLCVRCLGHDLEAVREDISRVVCVLRDKPMPRVWQT